MKCVFIQRNSWRKLKLVYFSKFYLCTVVLKYWYINTHTSAFQRQIIFVQISPNVMIKNSCHKHVLIIDNLANMAILSFKSDLTMQESFIIGVRVKVTHFSLVYSNTHALTHIQIHIRTHECCPAPNFRKVWRCLAPKISYKHVQIRDNWLISFNSLSNLILEITKNFL